MLRTLYGIRKLSHDDREIESSIFRATLSELRSKELTYFCLVFLIKLMMLHVVTCNAKRDLVSDIVQIQDHEERRKTK